MSTSIETEHELGPYKFYQRKPSHRLTAVTVLLCDFVESSFNDNCNVIDLGTASAVIPMLLSLKSKSCHFTGIEISEELIKTAERNLKENNLGGRISLINSDWRDLYDKFSGGSFTHVVSNPPYMKEGASRLSPDKVRRAARAEVYGNMSDLVKVSKYLAGNSGRIYYVYPMERLEDLKETITNEGLTIGRYKEVFTQKKDGVTGDAEFFLIEFGVGCKLVKEESVTLDGSRIY